MSEQEVQRIAPDILRGNYRLRSQGYGHLDDSMLGKVASPEKQAYEW